MSPNVFYSKPKSNFYFRLKWVNIFTYMSQWHQQIVLVWGEATLSYHICRDKKAWPVNQLIKWLYPYTLIIDYYSLIIDPWSWIRILLFSSQLPFFSSQFSVPNFQFSVYIHILKFSAICQYFLYINVFLHWCI